MKNKVHYSFLMGLTIIGLLLLLSSLPQFSIGPLDFKKIDLLSDISLPRADSISGESDRSGLGTLSPDSVPATQDSIARDRVEGCLPGLTCIEDYSGEKDALRNFIVSLIRTKRAGSALRIAFYGDSFIEGDVFCGSFRDTLQTIFGGRGVGFVPITSHVTGFRNTIRHKFSNWETSSLVLKTSDAELGPSGFTFIPQHGNMVEYKASKQRYLREFNRIKLYYKSKRGAILHYTVDTVESSDPLITSDRIEEWEFQRKGSRRARFEFDPCDSLWVYGASFESEGGIYVDNFSIRGNSGLNLNRIPPAMYDQFNRHRNYKLIILQFGLNLVAEEKLNYPAYVKRMVSVINRMKSVFPKASFLLLSVSDRSANIDGEYRTMPAIPRMRNAQRLIARESQIAFWDMYDAMGGENSMVKFVNAKPALGARDYTHLTFRGGRKLSGALVKSLMLELARHESAVSPDAVDKPVTRK